MHSSGASLAAAGLQRAAPAGRCISACGAAHATAGHPLCSTLRHHPLVTTTGTSAAAYIALTGDLGSSITALKEAVPLLVFPAKAVVAFPLVCGRMSLPSAKGFILEAAGWRQVVAAAMCARVLRDPRCRHFTLALPPGAPMPLPLTMCLPTNQPSTPHQQIYHYLGGIRHIYWDHAKHGNQVGERVGVDGWVGVWGWNRGPIIVRRWTKGWSRPKHHRTSTSPPLTLAPTNPPNHQTPAASRPTRTARWRFPRWSSAARCSWAPAWRPPQRRRFTPFEGYRLTSDLPTVSWWSVLDESGYAYLEERRLCAPLAPRARQCCTSPGGCLRAARGGCPRLYPRSVNESNPSLQSASLLFLPQRYMRPHGRCLMRRECKTLDTTIQQQAPRACQG